MHARRHIRVTTQPRGETRQNKSLIFFILAGLAVVAIAVFAWWRLTQPEVRRSKGPRERPVAEYVVTEKPTPMRQDLRLPKDYSKLPLEDAKPQAAPATPGQPAPPKPAPPPDRTGRWVKPTPPPPPQGLPAPPPAPGVIVQAPRSQPPMFRPVSTTGKPKTPERWFGPKAGIKDNLLTAPLPPDATDTAQSKVFPKAVWERPKDPTKVLYADQVVNGLLMQNLNSDAPGSFRIKVTQDVIDRWGLGTVLLPLDTTVMGAKDGQAKYGQKRIPAQVTMAILPDGTAVTFTKSQAGDAMGAAGIPANVDNHYGALILGAGIQALLSIGTRAVAGSTTGFNPTLEQEFAQDVARSINRSGNQIVQRELQRSPTLTQDTGFPVTIQFSENISFQSQPTVVSK